MPKRKDRYGNEVTRRGQVKTTNIDQRIQHFQEMLKQAEQRRKQIKQALDEMNANIDKINKALWQLQLYKLGISPHQAFQMKRQGKNLEDIKDDINP